MKTALLALGLLSLTATGAAAHDMASDPFLPAGPGRERVVAICTSCHNSRAFGQLREGPRGWRSHVGDMVLHGAQVRPEDLDPIVNYLSEALGPGVPLSGPEPATVTLPVGLGQELVEGACSMCHGLDRVVATRRSPREWGRIVNRMIFYGSPLSKGQVALVNSYLVSHFKTD